MSLVKVAEDKCVGCNACVDACPTDVFRAGPQGGPVLVAYPDDCCACQLCVEDCPTDCITIDPSLRSRGFISVYQML